MNASTVQVATGQDRYRSTARKWIAEAFPQTWRPDSIDYVSPSYDEQVDWERSLYEAGYAGFTWPVEYGGQGQTLIEQLIANEELGRVAIPDSLNGIGKDMIGPVILAIGSEAQKQRYLPRILRMDEIWCQGFSESEAGSDLAAVRTRAVQCTDGWTIEGRKIWTSFAQHADLCLVLARTGDPEQRHASLSLFIVPMDAPGISVRQIDQIDGRANFCELLLDSVRVSQDSILGAVNEGWAAAGRVLEIERAINRMYRASAFENELDHLVRACCSDEALSQLLHTSNYQERVGGICADIHILRRLVWKTVLCLAGGGSVSGAGSLIKLHWSETHQRLTTLARDLLTQASRPLTPITARAVARFDELYLRSRAETIQAGASAVQLGIIAGRILRLPKA
jgi:alkylation response protein AidB-like acyl-CoA dehydrogenase